LPLLRVLARIALNIAAREAEAAKAPAPTARRKPGRTA
jgi:hypothetical protein